MIHLIPTKTRTSAKDIADIFFGQIFRIHGLPEHIVSDRDPRFISKFWTALWKKTGTHLGMTSSYHPQTDGQTERANKTIEEMLRSYVQTNGSDWDKYLPALEFAYNSSIHATTGFSPFFLTYGRELRTPTIAATSS